MKYMHEQGALPIEGIHHIGQPYWYAEGGDMTPDEFGLKVAREGYCDRQYDDQGNLASRKIPGTVIKDPQVAAKQVVDMVVNGFIISRNGKRIEQRVDTLCVHGDEPTGVATARAARQALEAAGVKIVRLPDMNLG